MVLTSSDPLQARKVSNSVLRSIVLASRRVIPFDAKPFTLKWGYRTNVTDGATMRSQGQS